MVNERDIYVGGFKYEGEQLSIDDENILNKVLDSFEEGENQIKGGYEVYEYGKFVIKRKLNIDLTNTGKKLITMLNKNALALKKDSKHIKQFCDAIAALNLPDLEDNYKYTLRQKMQNGKLVGEEIISMREYWNDEAGCWYHDDEIKIGEISICW